MMNEATQQEEAAAVGESAVQCLVMPDDEAMKLAWEQVKDDCDLRGLPVGELMNYHGFFVWGWNYRAQLEKQRRGEV